MILTLLLLILKWALLIGSPLHNCRSRAWPGLAWPGRVGQTHSAQAQRAQAQGSAERAQVRSAQAHLAGAAGVSYPPCIIFLLDVVSRCYPSLLDVHTSHAFPC